MKFVNPLFADVYGGGVYSSDVYSSQGTQQTGTSTNPNNGGSLANTGFDVIIPVSLGLAVIGASVILLARRALRKKA